MTAPADADVARLLIDTFGPRADVYAKRWETQDEVDRYNAWLDRQTFLPKPPRAKLGGYKPAGKKGARKPVTAEAIARHVAGLDTLGVYPMRPDGTCSFVGVDFDNHRGDIVIVADPRADYEALVDVLVRQAVSYLGWHSRGGHGYWNGLLPPLGTTARDARAVLNGLLREAGVKNIKEGGTVDALFPKQDKPTRVRGNDPAASPGNLYALPLSRKWAANDPPGTVFVDVAPNDWDAQVEHLRKAQRISPEQWAELVARYPVPEKERKRTERKERDRRERPAWNESVDGLHPRVAAFQDRGMLGPREGEGYAAQCPWEHLHSDYPDRSGFDSGAILFASGFFYCHHSHWTETSRQSEVDERLGIPAAEVEDSQAVASVRSQFRPAPSTISLSESGMLIRAAYRSVDDTPLVLQVTAGAGKTRHAIEHAIERSKAVSDNQTVILCPTIMLVDEIAATLNKQGIPFRRARGIDSVKNADGSYVCSRMPEVIACQERKIPARAAICNRAYRGLSLGSPCEHRSTCAAADPFEGPTDARIILGTHAMAMLVLEEYPAAHGHVDESPDTDSTHVDLTPKKLRAAMKIASGLELKTLTARVELAMGMLVHHLESETDDFESAKRSWLETPDGREVAHRHFILNGSRGTFSAAFELELAIRDLTNPDHKLHDAPLIPRRGRPIMGAPEAWQTLDAVVALFSGRATHTERSGQTLTVTVPSPVWKALAEHPRLAIPDATPNVDKLTALLGRSLRVVRIDVAETAIVRRVIIPKRDLTRRALCPDDKVDPRNPRLRGAVRDVVSVILESAPKGSAGVIGSYQPVCTALKEAWETQSGALYELLKPLREQGYQVRFTFDRARDTKGVNEHDDCHFIGFIGNPLSNKDAASRTHKHFNGTDETFNAAWRNAAAQWLTQFVSRLRPVHRTGERLTMVLVGTVLPSDGWYEGNTEVVQRGSGRPVTDTTNVSDQVQALVAFHGSKRAAAKAIGCDEAKVRRMEKGEPVSEHLAAKVRTALQGADLKRVLKKKKDAHPVPHLNPHPNANVSDDLPADAFDAWAPPARSRSFPFPQSTAHRRESG